jgi:hypothetical protein
MGSAGSASRPDVAKSWQRTLRQRIECECEPQQGEPAVRSVLLYFIGVPIPIILLLAFCTHHF